MKRSTWFVMILIAALVIPAYAGEKPYSGCKEDAQSCLNHMAAKLKGRGWLGIEMEMQKPDGSDEAKGSVGPGGALPRVATKTVNPKSETPHPMMNLKVSRVVSGSPAEASGFRAGDILVSVNGANFADNTEERCVTCEKTEGWKPGAKVQYVVRRDGQELSLDATLAALPSDVMAQMIGMHMLEHAQAPEAEKAAK